MQCKVRVRKKECKNVKDTIADRRSMMLLRDIKESRRTRKLSNAPPGFLYMLSQCCHGWKCMLNCRDLVAGQQCWLRVSNRELFTTPRSPGSFEARCPARWSLLFSAGWYQSRLSGGHRSPIIESAFEIKREFSASPHLPRVTIQSDERFLKILIRRVVVPLLACVIRKVLLHRSCQKLLLEEIGLVEEENDRGRQKPLGIADRFEQH